MWRWRRRSWRIDELAGGFEPGRFEFIAITRSVKELKGMFGKPAKAVSIDDMNRAIATRGASAR